MKMLRPLTSPLCLVVLSACVGPDYARPALPVAQSYVPAASEARVASHVNTQMRVPASWWEAFESPELNVFVGDVLRANHDIKAAQAALRVAQETYRAQSATIFPMISASAEQSRAKSPSSLSPTPASGASIYSLTTAQVSVSYPLDLFGGNRRETEAARARAEAQSYQTEVTRLTLTANAVSLAIGEASLRAQIAATERLIALETDALDVLTHQLAFGQIAEADVIAERAAVAQVRASLPPLRLKLAQQRSAMAVLAGRLPSEDIPQHFELSSIHIPGALPLSLPSQLVEHRPDVRAAEAALHAATAEVGVATANMLPDIPLSGAWGVSNVGGSSLFAAGNGFWSIAANAAQPLFQGGALLHKRRAAVAAADQAAELYKSTVLAAFQNVADVLHAIAFDAETLGEARIAASAAEDSLTIVRHQLDLGQVSSLALINAERTGQQATLTLLQAETARLNDATALFQALGGGWGSANVSTFRAGNVDPAKAG